MAEPLRYDPERLLKANDASRVVLENYLYSEREMVAPKREQWKEGYKAYRMVIDEAKDTGLQSKLVIPLIFTNVEDILPRLVAHRPNIQVWPRDMRDEGRATQHRMLLEYDWDIMSMPYKLVEIVKSAEIFGTAFVQSLHKRIVGPRAKRVFEDRIVSAFGIPVGTERVPSFRVDRESLIYDDPDVDLLEVDQVFPHPGFKTIEAAPWVIVRTEAQLHEIEQMRSEGGESFFDKKVVAQLKAKLKAGNPRADGNTVESIRQMQRTTFDGAGRETNDPYLRQVHLLWQWEDSKLTVIVEEFPDLPPLRQKWNEFGAKPVRRFTPIPDVNALYGISIPEILYSLELELTTMHEARLDNLMYSVHQMYTIMRNSGINPRQLRWRPNGYVWVKSPQDIRPLERNFMDFSIYREDDNLNRWAQKAGVTDTFSGVRSNLTGRTATEASLLAEASGSRASLMFVIMQEQLLKPLGEDLMRWNDLYIDRAKAIPIIGDEISGYRYIEIDPEVLHSGTGQNLDVRIDISQVEPGNRQLALQRSQIGLQTLGAMQFPLDHPFMERMLIDFGRGIGMEQPEQYVTSQQARQSATLAQQSRGAPGEAPSRQETAGDQLAAALGAQAGGIA